jgi:hypothetical protein
MSSILEAPTPSKACLTQEAAVFSTAAFNELFVRSGLEAARTV